MYSRIKGKERQVLFLDTHTQALLQAVCFPPLRRARRAAFFLDSGLGHLLQVPALPAPDHRTERGKGVPPSLPSHSLPTPPERCSSACKSSSDMRNAERQQELIGPPGAGESGHSIHIASCCTAVLKSTLIVTGALYRRRVRATPAILGIARRPTSSAPRPKTKLHLAPGRLKRVGFTTSTSTSTSVGKTSRQWLVVVAPAPAATAMRLLLLLLLLVDATTVIASPARASHPTANAAPPLCSGQAIPVGCQKEEGQHPTRYGVASLSYPHGTVLYFLFFPSFFFAFVNRLPRQLISLFPRFH